MGLSMSENQMQQSSDKWIEKVLNKSEIISTNDTSI